MSTSTSTKRTPATSTKAKATTKRTPAKAKASGTKATEATAKATLIVPRNPGETMVAYRKRRAVTIRENLSQVDRFERMAGEGVLDVHSTFTKADGKPDAEAFERWCEANLDIRRAYAYRLLRVARVAKRHPAILGVTTSVTALNVAAGAPDDVIEAIAKAKKPLTAAGMADAIAKRTPDGAKASKASKAGGSDKRLDAATKAVTAGMRKANAAGIAYLAKASNLSDDDKRRAMAAITAAFAAGLDAGAKAGALSAKAYAKAKADADAAAAKRRADAAAAK